MSTKCPRYIIASHNYSGLGHRIGVVAFVVNLAKEFGFTPVLHDNLKSGFHGDTPDFKELLGLNSLVYESEIDLSSYSHFTVRTRDAFVSEYLAKYRTACGIAVTAALGHRAACDDGAYCFGKWRGAFERARR